MKKIWIVLISVVVSGGLVGGGTYYCVNKKAVQDKDNLQKQINDLNNKLSSTEESLSEANSANVDADSSVSADEIANWKTYTGTYEGLTLKYPATWTLTQSNKKSSDYPGTDWNGPFDGFALTGPNGFKIKYTTHVDGIGGGCDMGVNCNKYYWQNIYQMTNANYSGLVLGQYEARESDNKTLINRGISVWKPGASMGTLVTGATYEGVLFSVYDDKGVDKILSSITGSFDGSTNMNLSTTDFFNLPDVKEAVKILKTVHFSK